MARSAAILYCAWSLVVYFGTLRGDHAWWPLFLYFIIWPLSAVWHIVSKEVLHYLAPNPTSVAYWAYDGVSGAFYIVAGSAWVYLLVGLVVRWWRHLFEENVSALTPPK